MTYEDFLRQVQKDLQDSFANQTEEKYAKVTIGIGNVNKIQGESYRGITFVNGESYIIDKARLSIRLTAPYSEERRKAASDRAKKWDQRSSGGV